MLDTIRGDTAGSIIDKLTCIKKALASRSPAAAILFWIGHGRAAQNELRLIIVECFDPISGCDGLAPAQVVGYLADAKVKYIIRSARCLPGGRYQCPVDHGGSKTFF